MAAIRVTIGDMPPLLRSLVEGMLDEDPQVEIVAEDRGAPGTAGSPAAVDVMVISEDAMKRVVPLSTAGDGRSALGVVAIARDGLDAAVVHLSAHRRKLDDGRWQTLSAAIRDAAGVLPAAR